MIAGDAPREYSLEEGRWPQRGDPNYLGAVADWSSSWRGRVVQSESQPRGIYDNEKPSAPAVVTTLRPPHGALLVQSLHALFQHRLSTRRFDMVLEYTCFFNHF